MNPEMSRRDVIKTLGVGAAAMMTARFATRAEEKTAVEAAPRTDAATVKPAGPPSSEITLPKLPYASDALEPHIDAQTMEIHHTKHHQAYITNFLKAIEPYPDLKTRSVEDLLRQIGTLPAEVRGAVRNHGGGHVNHALFWTVMKPGGGGQPKGELGERIQKQFGGFDRFKELFANEAVRRFGSGWAWLCRTKGSLAVYSSPNQDSPWMEANHVPILGLDVWEHAYYLKYQWQRAKYVEAWWNVVNWDEVASRYAAAGKQFS
jgi:Fe-Mn family superoxide dismutase